MTPSPHKALYDIFASLVVIIRNHTTDQEDLASVMAEVERLVDTSSVSRAAHTKRGSIST